MLLHLLAICSNRRCLFVLWIRYLSTSEIRYIMVYNIALGSRKFVTQRTSRELQSVQTDLKFAVYSLHDTVFTIILEYIQRIYEECYVRAFKKTIDYSSAFNQSRLVSDLALFCYACSKIRTFIALVNLLVRFIFWFLIS